MFNITTSYCTSSATVKSTAGNLHCISAIATASAGTVILKDGGSGGSTIWEMSTPATAGVCNSIAFPGNGVRFESNLYVALSNAFASIGWS